MGSGRDRYQGPSDDDFTTDYGSTEDGLPRRRTRRFDAGPETTGQGRYRETGQGQRERRTRDFQREPDTTIRRRARPAHVPPPSPRRYQDNYDDDEYYEPSRSRRRRKRSIWPAILGGCAIGIVVAVVAAGVVVFLALRSAQTGLPTSGGLPGIGGNTSQVFTDKTTTPIQLSSLTTLQVCDKIGNISIATNPGIQQAQVIATKIVHAASKTDAQQEFKKIAVEVQPPGTITNPSTCTRAVATPTPPAATTPTTGAGGASNSLTVNVTLPSNGGLLQTESDAVDVQVTLPTSLANAGSASSGAAPLFVNVQAPLGNITIDGLQGVLQIKGSSGNIMLTHTMLLDGSSIDTGQGNITFNGSLVPAVDPNASSSYILQSEQGTIDVTLPGTTNVTLDASSNNGFIHGSDFSINVNGNGGPVTYRGALNAATTSDKAVLTVDVSIGNITLHKAS